MRTPLVRTSFATLALALGLSACSDPDVTRDDLVSMLTERGDISDDQANCIADDIFAEDLFSQGELNDAALDPTKVEGFQETVDAAIAECGIG